MVMIHIVYPQHEFRLRKEAGKELIFDELRRLWVRLTPEEWVRQHFLQYLLQGMKYPGSLIAVEKEILLGEMKKRFDILVYDPQHQPWMIVECKATHVPLEEGVLQQALRYSIVVPAPYIIITNGQNSVGWDKRSGQLVEQDKLPDWGT